MVTTSRSASRPKVANRPILVVVVRVVEMVPVRVVEIVPVVEMVPVLVVEIVPVLVVEMIPLLENPIGDITKSKNIEQTVTFRFFIGLLLVQKRQGDWFKQLA